MEDINSNKIQLRVCILNWNGGEDLQRCIDSLFRNSNQDFKITVIDNNSTDNSLKHIRPDIDIVRFNKNHGYSKGYNLGIEKSAKDDEYIILLNFDTIVAPDFISSLLKEIKIKGKNYIYGVKILYGNNKNLIWYAGGKIDLPKGIICHIGLRENSQKYSLMRKTDYVTGCCLIVHKQNYQKLNGFDTQFFMYNEDVDFCLRAKNIGLECLYLPSSVIYHNVSTSTGGNYSMKKMLLKTKSSYLLFRKYYSLPISLFLLLIYFNRTLFGINQIKKQN